MEVKNGAYYTYEYQGDKFLTKCVKGWLHDITKLTNNNPVEIMVDWIYVHDSHQHFNFTEIVDVENSYPEYLV